jgi:hypothetical protein
MKMGCGMEWKMKLKRERLCYCTLDVIAVLRAVRKEMGALFWTIPWYSSSSDISFRVTESRCACILILGTSWRNGSVNCILRKMMFRFISWMTTRMLYRTSLSDIPSKMAGWGLLYIISLGVSSMRAVYSLVNYAIVCNRTSPNSSHSFSA